MWSVSDGEVVVATARAVNTPRLVTALTLHPALDLEQRVVIVLVLLGALGPPWHQPATD
jgi:hypothetical protein